MALTSDTDPLTQQTGLDAAGRSERARLAARRRWDGTTPEDRVEVALMLREATLVKFEQEVDPNRELATETRRELAEQAWREHIRTKARLRWARWKALEKAGLTDDPEALALAED